MKDILDLIKSPILENNYLVDLKNKIIKRVKDVKLDDSKFKLEPKNILFICVLVESTIDKNNKLNKRDFVINIMRELYTIDQNEEANIKAIIDLLHLQGKIKRKSYYKLWMTSILECFRL